MKAPRKPSRPKRAAAPARAAKPAAAPVPEIKEAATVRALARVLDETGLTEIEIGDGERYVRVARGTTAMAVGYAPAPTASIPAGGGVPDVPVDQHPGVVKSPMVGTLYTSAEPGQPPFVRVGDAVKEGDTLFLIEAMKVFNPIPAHAAGRVARILVSNGAPVEFGEPLLVIE